MAEKKGTPAWVWIGCGCLLCIVLLVGGIVGAGFYGVGFFKSMVEDMADPLARAEATMKLLGAEKLPDGWYSHAFFSFPMVMKVAILTDSEQPPEAIEGTFEEKTHALENLVLRHDQMGPNVFVYLDMRGRGDEALEDLLAGRSHPASSRQTHVDLNLELQPLEDLGRGDLEIGKQKIEWRAHRGLLDTVGGQDEGIYAVLRISCPGDKKSDALWFQRASRPDGAEESPEVESPEVEASEVEAADIEVPAREGTSLEGTPADPAALAWLFGHFHLC